MPSDHRLHPASILFAFARSLRRFALPAVVAALAAGRSTEPPPFAGRWLPPGAELENWQIGLLVFLVPSALLAIARYVSFRLRYESTEIIIRSGIIFRNERHLPYLRIQNLNAVRNVAHRLLGVTEVRVETGGGEKPEATLSVLHMSAYEEMRRRVMAGRAATIDVASSPDDAADARTLLRLPIGELLLQGLLENRGTVLVGAASGMLWQLGLVEAVGSRILSVSGWASGGLAVRSALVIGAVLAVRMLSVAWATTRLYDFHVARVGGDLRAEYGLLTRVLTTIPLHRVQTLTIRESPLQRLAGRMSVLVETAGGRAVATEGGKRELEWIAPIVRAGDTAALVRQVIPAFDLDTISWQPVDPRAFRRAVKPALLAGAAMTAPLLGALGWRAVAILPLTLGWMTFVAWKQVRHLAWGVTGHEVVFRSGWLWRNVTVAPFSKIQAIGYNESPFDRRHAMAKVRVDTAGANERSHRVHIPYLARQTAAALYRRLSAEASRTAFRW